MMTERGQGEIQERRRIPGRRNGRMPFATRCLVLLSSSSLCRSFGGTIGMKLVEWKMCTKEIVVNDNGIISITYSVP